jgi:hypothetical protein
VVSNLERIDPMSLQNHLAELERRHKVLETEIEKELLHPAADEGHLHELKKKNTIKAVCLSRLKD